MTKQNDLSKQANESVRILLIGPMPPPAGGTTVLFEQLARELKSIDEVTVFIVNTFGGRGRWRSLCRAVIVTCLILSKIASCDVLSFHSSRQGAIWFSSIVLLLSRVFRKPWLFRGFGNFESWHQDATRLEKTIFGLTALQANLVLFETRSSVAYFQGRTSSTVLWYPNSRPRLTAAAKAGGHADASLRFVFVGHVKPSKGIRELIEAAERLDGVTVDVYGPLFEGITQSDFRGARARYRGFLEPDAVANVLRGYDMVLLPTFYEGEGYPGIILEGYAQGLPVIATRWNAISEIVTNDTGLLIEPRNTDALVAAMQQVLHSRELFIRLCDGAFESAKQFSSIVWTKYYVDICRDLVKRVD